MRLAIDAAVKAGKEIMRIYNSPDQDFGIEQKSDKSPVTLADKAAHRCITKHLAPSGIPILSEEGRAVPYERRQTWHRVWIVDPLDGTKEFIKKNGEFTVNIALVEDGNPVLGIIYVLALSELYVGLVGFMANKCTGDGVLNFRSMPFLSREPRPFTVVASRSHMTPETEYYIKLMRKEHGEVQVVSRGSSLKFCTVAEGNADVYPRLAPTMEWDTAAGDAIARAAGRKVVDAETGKPLTYNKPDLHNPSFIVS